MRSIIIGPWPEVTPAGIPGRDGLALNPLTPTHTSNPGTEFFLQRAMSAKLCPVTNGEGVTQKDKVCNQICSENAELNRFLNAGLF